MNFSSVHNILLLVKNKKTNDCMKIEKGVKTKSYKKRAHKVTCIHYAQLYFLKEKTVQL